MINRIYEETPEDDGRDPIHKTHVNRLAHYKFGEDGHLDFHASYGTETDSTYLNRIRGILLDCSEMDGDEDEWERHGQDFLDALEHKYGTGPSIPRIYRRKDYES